MKIRTLLGIFFVIAGLCGLGMHAPAQGADIVYPGAPLDIDPLYSDPNSLFPGTSLSGNTVTVNGGTITGYVYGGVDGGALAVSGNLVTINDGTITEFVSGGGSNTGAAFNNTVILNGGTTNDLVNGGYAYGTGEVYGNTVIVNGGTHNAADSFVDGGRSDDGDSHDNSVTVYGGDLGGVYGSYTLTNGNVARGMVNIYGGTFDNSVAGGRSDGAGDVTDSVTTIQDGTFNSGSVYGGRSITGNVSGNTLNVSGGTFDPAVYLYGSRTNDGGGGGGDATSNTVSISGGSIGGGVYGADTDGGVATSNTVTVTAGTIGGPVVGGSTANGNAASYNSVTISGGTFSGDVYGAFADNSGDAVGNSVTLIGSTPAFSGTTSLYGGSTGGLSSDNLLSVRGFTGTFANINYFQKYEFLMPANLTPGSPMLTVTGPPVDLSTATSINILGMEAGGYMPQTGDTFVLISSTTNDFAAPNNFDLKKGAFTLIPADWRTDGTGLIVEILGPARTDPGTKGLNDGKLAGLMFARQGTDLLVDSGIGNAVAERKLRNDCLPVLFAAMGGGTNRYDTGHLHVDGFSMLAGLAWGTDKLPSARLTYGAFFEFGFGHYDSRNTFSNTGRVKGKGDLGYVGGGLMGRLDFSNGFELEASGRMGSSRAEYRTHDMTTASGRGVRYDSRGLYYGLHAGVGYNRDLGNMFGLKLYSKYMWTRQNSDRVNVQDEWLHFDAADSHVWKTGARMSYQATERLVPYLGAAYEYEFDGKATGRVHGLALNPSKIKGSTGMVEAGLIVRQVPGSPVRVDVGVQAYAGKRKGVNGSVWFRYDF